MEPSARLRVLVVAHNAVAESNRRRVEALAQIPGTQVALLTPRWWFEEGRRVTAPASAPWGVGRTIGTGNGTRYVYVSHLLGLVRRFAPEVIDVHEEPFSLAALEVLLARAALAPRAALVFYSAVNVARRWRLPYRLAERLVLRGADGAYVPSREVDGVLRRKGYRGPLETIPLGVDLERFARAQPLDLEAGLLRPRIGFLGRLEPVKGVDVLVEAAARLAGRNGRPFSLVIAGDGPERDRLRRLVASAGLAGRVSFLGEVAYADVPGLLKALDVLVLPSVTLLPLHREQFGRVLVEAMAAGVPVVGSSSGAIPEVIGDAGLVVPERDPVALAGALERLLGDDHLRGALAERGRQRATSQYAWPVVAGRTRELYLRAVAHRLAHRPRWPGATPRALKAGLSGAGSRAAGRDATGRAPSGPAGLDQPPGLAGRHGFDGLADPQGTQGIHSLNRPPGLAGTHGAEGMPGTDSTPGTPDIHGLAGGRGAGGAGWAGGAAERPA